MYISKVALASCTNFEGYKSVVIFHDLIRSLLLKSSHLPFFFREVRPPCPMVLPLPGLLLGRLVLLR